MESSFAMFILYLEVCILFFWVAGKLWRSKSRCITGFLALNKPSSNHYRMTYIVFWTKRKGTSCWPLLTIIIPLLHRHPIYCDLNSEPEPISWISQLLLSQRLVQSTVSNRIIMLALKHAPFNFLEGKLSDMIDFKPSYQAVKGQRAEQLQTPPAHSTEEISTFHAKDSSSWMAWDKSCYWVISDFQELVAMVQTDCMHSLFTSHFLLFISNKKSHFQEIKGFFVKLDLHRKCTNLTHFVWLQQSKCSILWLRCCRSAIFALLSLKLL